MRDPKANELLAYVEQTKKRYDLFTQALAGAFGRTLDGPTPMLPKARNDLDQELLRAVSGFVFDEDMRMRDISARIAQEGLQPAKVEMTGEFSDNINEMRTQYKENVRGQATRDRYLIKGFMMRLAITTNMLMNQRAWARSAAFMNARKNMKALEFAFIDRIGRRWKSTRYIEVMAHSFLFTLHNESVMWALSQNGVNIGVVRSENRTIDGMRVRFVDDGLGDTVPVYADIKESVFHPGSDAIIVPET